MSGCAVRVLYSIQYCTIRTYALESTWNKAAMTLKLTHFFTLYSTFQKKTCILVKYIILVSYWTHFRHTFSSSRKRTPTFKSFDSTRNLFSLINRRSISNFLTPPHPPNPSHFWRIPQNLTNKIQGLGPGGKQIAQNNEN